MEYQQADRADAYLKTLHEKLLTFYKKVKHGDIDEALRSQSQGYIQAGILLGVIDQESARTFMEKAHFDVFQQTIDERLEHKQDLLKFLAEGDDAIIREPAVIRNRGGEHFKLS